MVCSSVPDLIPGPLSPFAGLAAGNDGTIYIAGDGEGSILTLKPAAYMEGTPRFGERSGV
jgi:hypothetical protein